LRNYPTQTRKCLAVGGVADPLDASWDESPEKQDEPQELALTFAVPGCVAWPYSEYHSLISLAAQATKGEGTMGRKLFVLLTVTILAASIPAESKTRGPSTPQERARALDYIQSLEQNPLAKDSLDKRMWLTEWIVQVPDFTVKSC